MTLKLPSGTTGFFNERNEWVCTGSQMGRRNRVPSDTSQPFKLHLQRLPMVDGDYDQWGAYWGATPGTAIYCAWQDQPEAFGDSLQRLEFFTRASNRDDAKRKVRAELPNARFYR